MAFLASCKPNDSRKFFKTSNCVAGQSSQVYRTNRNFPQVLIKHSNHRDLLPLEKGKVTWVQNHSSLPQETPQLKREKFQRSIDFNALSAEVVGFISRTLIERELFQNTNIPAELLLSLANDLINTLSAKPHEELFSLSKEVTILWKQFRGQALTRQEKKYDDTLHQIDVIKEVLNGIKYSSIFLMGQSFYASMAAAVEQRLWTHIPMVCAYFGMAFSGYQGVQAAVSLTLKNTKLSKKEQAQIKPWLNMVGRLALGLTPKVHANERGVHYHYPSTQGHVKSVSPDQTLTVQGELLTLEKPGTLTTPEGLYEGSYNAKIQLDHIDQLSEEKITIHVKGSHGHSVPVEFKKVQGKYGPEVTVQSQDKALERHWSNYFEAQETSGTHQPSALEASPEAFPQQLERSVKVTSPPSIGRQLAQTLINSVFHLTSNILHLVKSGWHQTSSFSHQIRSFELLPSFELPSLIPGAYGQEIDVAQPELSTPLMTYTASETDAFSKMFTQLGVCSRDIASYKQQAQNQENPIAFLTTQTFETIFSSHKSINWSNIDKKQVSRLKDAQGYNLIQKAVATQKKDCIEHLLEAFSETAMVAGPHEDQRTPLHVATILQRADLIDFLAGKYSINEKDSAGFTPLHLAIYQRDLKTAAALLMKGASIEETYLDAENNEHSPLSMVIDSGNPEMLDLFLKSDYSQNLDLLEHVPSFGTILHLAIHSNQSPMLEHLLTKKHDQIQTLLEKKDLQQRTPLQLAAYLGDTQAIELLVTQGAKINKGVRKKHGTAVHYAVLGRQPDAIQLLDFHGANLEALDNRAQPPLALAKALAKEESSSALNACKALLETLPQVKDNMKTRPPNFIRRPPFNLVFAGGGPKAIGIVGALKQIEEIKAMQYVKRTAGTSAGAITAALLSIGYKADELEGFLEKDFIDLLDFKGTFEKELLTEHKLFVNSLKKLWNNFSIRSPIESLKNIFINAMKYKGLCKGEELRLWIEELIYNATGRHNCTFKELATLIRQNPSKYKELHIFALKPVDGPNSEIVRFSHEDPAWESLIISDAIRASTSIPVVFEPHILHFKDAKGKRYPRPDLGKFIDGGLLRNFPLDAFDRFKYQEDKLFKGETTNRRTLGFYLKEDFQPPKEGIKTGLELANATAWTYYYVEDLLRAEKPFNQGRTISIPVVEGVGLTNFNVSAEKKAAMQKSGKNAAKAFFNGEFRSSNREKNAIQKKNILA